MFAVIKIMFLGLFILGTGVLSNKITASEQSGRKYDELPLDFRHWLSSKYGGKIQTLAYKWINNRTIIFYDDNRMPSNVLFLSSTTLLYIDAATIEHIYNTLFAFIHSNEITVKREDKWVVIDGYFERGTILIVPFSFLVTVQQAYLMYNRIRTEIAEDDSIVNKPYNYTIAPSIVLQLNLMPSFNTPSYGNMTLLYYKYVQFFRYITKFYIYIQITAYLFIILGSLLICTSILKYKILTTPPNVYVFSLAVSDILHFSMRLIGLVCVRVESNPFKGWSFLRITVTIVEICWNVVCWTAIGITIDRYIAICHPFLARRISTKNRAVKVNIFIWSLSLILTIMDVVYGDFYLKDVDEQAIQSATRSLILMVVVPMCIILPAYICIIRNILKSSRLRESCSISEQTLTNKSIKIAAVVAVQFVVCFAPTFGFTYVWKIFNPNRKPLRHQIISFLVVGLNTFGCMINPLLYALVSIHFRQAFKDIGLLCLGRTRRLLCCGKGATPADQNIALNQF